MLVALVTVFTCLVALLWGWGKWRHGYWQRRGIPSPPATTFLGHLHHHFSTTRPHWDFIDEAYRNYGGKGVCGLYNFLTPQLLVGDPALLRDILVKDFDHFVDRRHLTLGPEDQLWNDMLNNATGDRWRRIRTAVTPAFSSGHLRTMFHLIQTKARVLARVAGEMARGDSAAHTSVVMKKLLGRFSMDAVASCGFGMECNCLENEDGDFSKRAAIIFNPSHWRVLKLMSFYIFPRVFRLLGMKVTSEGLRYYAQVVTEALQHRQESGEKHGDFLDLMIEARKIPDQETLKGRKHALEDITVVSQAVVFLLSGYDNVGTALAFCCHHLAQDPASQHRAREELRQLKEEHGGSITYEAVMEAKFLDACISETLRLYPIETSFNRQCVKDYKLGKTELSVKAGMVLQVPVWSLHRDPEYWPDPNQFRPERFLPENKAQILPYTYLPFGAGPRNCIGQRFTTMKCKAALAELLLSVELLPAPGQPYEPELVVSPIILRPKNGIPLILKSLKELPE